MLIQDSSVSLLQLLELILLGRDVLVKHAALRGGRMSLEHSFLSYGIDFNRV